MKVENPRLLIEEPERVDPLEPEAAEKDLGCNELVLDSVTPFVDEKTAWDLLA